MRLLSRYPATVSLSILTALLGLSWFTTRSDARYESSSALNALVDFPDQLGGGDGIWIAVRNVSIPSSQERLLDLSDYVSREFRRLGSYPTVTATVFIAYCMDARTMTGHHPPHCYPASGWSMQAEETMTSSFLRKDGRSVEYCVYQFHRDPIKKKNLTIVNGFFAHPGFFAATLEEASEQVGAVFFGRKGLFQFQILFQELESGADVKRYAEELMQGIPSSVFDLAFGIDEIQASTIENARGAES